MYYLERMLTAVNDMPVNVESISMRLHMHHCSSSSKAQQQTTFANTDRRLMCLEAELTNDSNYNSTVNFAHFDAHDL